MLRSRRNALVSTCLLVLAALGFTAMQSVGAPPVNSPITGDSHCTGEATHAALTSFTNAFNRSDSEALDALFAEEPSFQWYSSARPGTRLGLGARNRSTLLDYFHRRDQAGDRLAVLSFDFNGETGRYGNFGLELRRSVPGFKHGDWFQLDAKGALVCGDDSARFIVMSLGPPKPPVRRTAG